MNKAKIKLKIIKDDSLCFKRVKYGNGFRFLNEHGKRIRNKILLKRLRKLVIPPMWSDVQICKWPDGHIQATGRDTKGRKQYIYHTIWEKQRQQEKFKNIVDFGNNLSKIRKQAHKDVKSKAWNKSKILGLLILILDETGIRIGNQQYAERNGTYGLSTLRRKHLFIENEEVIFQYKGKSNQQRKVLIDDLHLIKLIKKSSELPGYELFRYKDCSGKFHSIDSEDVNEYIHTHMGDDFYSKDFRTWAATRMAVEMFPIALQEQKDNPRKKITNVLLRLVADELGNTPTVCKSYYVHPVIMQKIESKALPKIDKYIEDPYLHGFSASEKLILDVV